ncbi:MAG: hypothetical protein XE10_1759 [Methanoculleus marisnigri]|jgi:hypothetical protein|uniref:Uncharacterized protein n=1 Tax=Methanoculleus marisnigri TaxID=2198 RepID=A0A101IRD5_9EURY|nr:MAG: hypothetical protein XE10_1759 [Methanoculleus marisnigri]
MVSPGAVVHSVPCTLDQDIDAQGCSDVPGAIASRSAARLPGFCAALLPAISSHIHF